MHAVLHSVWPIQVECCHGYLVVQMTQKAQGAATDSVARAPYCLAWNRGEVPSLLTFCATMYSTMMPLQSRSPICTGCTTMHGKLMHNHVRIAFPASKERLSGQKFAKQAWMPRCTPCASYQPFTTIVLENRLECILIWPPLSISQASHHALHISAPLWTCV